MMVPIPPRILVVEDDRSVRDAIADYLAGSGLVVKTAADGREADRVLASEAVDLVVLDLMLPGEDGLSICRRVSAQGPPVLMLSAVGAALDRIVGLECGASDYLAKPFEPRELLARIRAILRRAPPAPDRAALRVFAGLRYNVTDASLTDEDGAAVSLTAGEMRLLGAFLERPFRLLTRSVILDLTHREAAEPFDRAIDLAVSRLRRKLKEASGQNVIETVRGAGYRFIAAVKTA